MLFSWSADSSPVRLSAAVAIAPAIAERGGRLPLRAVRRCCCCSACSWWHCCRRSPRMVAATRVAAARIAAARNRSAVPWSLDAQEESTHHMRHRLHSLAAGPAAENWPQWRGPALNGVSAETNLPVRWSKTDNIAWKLAMPAWSGSTPIVWGDRNLSERGRRRQLVSVVRGSNARNGALEARWAAGTPGCRSRTCPRHHL